MDLFVGVSRLYRFWVVIYLSELFVVIDLVIEFGDFRLLISVFNIYDNILLNVKSIYNYV